VRVSAYYSTRDGEAPPRLDESTQAMTGYEKGVRFNVVSVLMFHAREA
jgi:hypothetical protein